MKGIWGDPSPSVRILGFLNLSNSLGLLEPGLGVPEDARAAAGLVALHDVLVFVSKDGGTWGTCAAAFTINSQTAHCQHANDIRDSFRSLSHGCRFGAASSKTRLPPVVVFFSATNQPNSQTQGRTWYLQRQGSERH